MRLDEERLDGLYDVIVRPPRFRILLAFFVGVGGQDDDREAPTSQRLPQGAGIHANAAPCSHMQSQEQKVRRDLGRSWSRAWMPSFRFFDA